MKSLTLWSNDDEATTFSKSVYEDKEKSLKEGQWWKYPFFYIYIYYVAIEIQHCFISRLLLADAAINSVSK